MERIKSFTSLAKIEAAKIGRVAFLEPEIEIVPDNSFFPLIKSFCIKEILYLWKSNTFLFHIFTFSFCIRNFGFSFPFINTNCATPSLA